MPLEEFVLTDEEKNDTDVLEGEPEVFAEIFNERMKPGQYYVARQCVSADPRATIKFQNYLSALREHNLDVGNGPEFAFGYRMPLPEKKDQFRKLIIFRRT